MLFKKISKPALILAFYTFCFTIYAQKAIEVDFKAHFAKYGVDGCFVLYNESDQEFLRYSPQRCDVGYIPASTFKIPHAIIALEEGIIKDTAQTIPWNGQEWPTPAWNQDQTLKTSIKNSCIWVYMEFARKIGINTYYTYVGDFNYGNQDLTGPPDRFWLAGEFKISANQQVAFLRKFYHNEIKVDQQNIDYVKDFIVLDSTDQYIFSGKTGGGVLAENKYVMWLVGYLERNDNVYYYAMNFESDDFNSTRNARIEIVKSILKELNLLD
jgi:beta-lactamase class D